MREGSFEEGAKEARRGLEKMGETAMLSNVLYDVMLVVPDLEDKTPRIIDADPDLEGHVTPRGENMSAMPASPGMYSCKVLPVESESGIRLDVVKCIMLHPLLDKEHIERFRSPAVFNPIDMGEGI
jgi:hypothetical protein